jgi:hypothetical protein
MTSCPGNGVLRAPDPLADVQSRYAYPVSGSQRTCYREQGSRSVGSDDALLEKRLEPRNDLKNRVALVNQLPGRRSLAPLR